MKDQRRWMVRVEGKPRLPKREPEQPQWEGNLDPAEARWSPMLSVAELDQQVLGRVLAITHTESLVTSVSILKKSCG